MQTATPTTVLFRCDASREIGLGHLVRCLAIASALRDDQGIRSVFAIREDDLGRDLTRQAGFDLIDGPATQDELHWIWHGVQTSGASGLVLDLKTAPRPEAVRRLQAAGVLTAVLDDPSEIRLSCDLAFYPPVDQALALEWPGFQGERFIDWDWIPLRRQFADQRGRCEGPRPADIPRVFVCMGGSDPMNLTAKAMRAILLLPSPVHSDVVVGSGCAFLPELKALAASNPDRFTLHLDVHEVAALMDRAALAFVSFGMTAYECAALGLPTVSWALTPDHDLSAQAFARAGMGRHLGLHNRVREPDAADALEKGLQNSVTSPNAGRHSEPPIDGLGAERIARTVADRIKTRSLVWIR